MKSEGQTLAAGRRKAVEPLLSKVICSPWPVLGLGSEPRALSATDINSPAVLGLFVPILSRLSGHISWTITARASSTQGCQVQLISFYFIILFHFSFSHTFGFYVQTELRDNILNGF